ncbi:MAG: aldo/keto reductase [Acidimicrobiia bacterium]|nr:aldo/keto reductase [Acidimicrobiia bacterium]
MQHVQLGRTGLQVSKLCLGTMTFGLQCDEERSRAILDRAAEGGITFLDTADAYPIGGQGAERGRTEEILGRWLAGRRDDYVLATKCGVPMSRRRWDRGGSRKHILDAVDGSLRRLQTDYIDLYQLHLDDLHTPLDETIAAFDHLVQVGKVRYVGCSNYSAWRLARALGRAEVLGAARYDCVQPRYNLLHRAAERDLFELCEAEGVGVIPYNPIAGGMLSGKHRRGDAPTEGTRFTLGTAAGRYQDRYWHDSTFDTVERLGALAEGAAMSLVTLAAAWCLAQPAVTAPIVGASKPEQLVDALVAADTALAPDLQAEVDELTRPYRLVEQQR